MAGPGPRLMTTDARVDDIATRVDTLELGIDGLGRELRRVGDKVEALDEHERRRIRDLGVSLTASSEMAQARDEELAEAIAAIRKDMAETIETGAKMAEVYESVKKWGPWALLLVLMLGERAGPFLAVVLPALGIELTPELAGVVAP